MEKLLRIKLADGRIQEFGPGQYTDSFIKTATTGDFNQGDLVVLNGDKEIARFSAGEWVERTNVHR